MKKKNGCDRSAGIVHVMREIIGDFPDYYASLKLDAGICVCIAEVLGRLRAAGPMDEDEVKRLNLLADLRVKLFGKCPPDAPPKIEYDG